MHQKKLFTSNPHCRRQFYEQEHCASLRKIISYSLVVKEFPNILYIVHEPHFDRIPTSQPIHACGLVNSPPTSIDPGLLNKGPVVRSFGYILDPGHDIETVRVVACKSRLYEIVALEIQFCCFAIEMAGMYGPI
jgi:hypothetical protein